MNYARLNIRWRLTLWNAIAFALILTAFGFVVYVLLRDAHFKMLDKALSRRANSFVEALEEGKSTDQVISEWITRFGNHGEYQAFLLDKNQNTLAATEGLTNEDIARIISKTSGAEVGTLVDVRLKRHRFTSFDLSTSEQANRVFVLADLEHLEEELALVRATFLWAIPPALLLAAALSYWLAVRALSPVERLRKNTDAITATDLHQRISVANAHDEIGQLTLTVNALFGRLEHAFDEIKRFSADASHELRTPITIIQSEAEMCLQQAASGTRTAERLQSIIEECKRLTDLTSQLLQLSRAESNPAMTANAPFALNKLLLEVIDSFEPIALKNAVALKYLEPEGSCLVRGDRDAMRQVFHNLVDNAIKYNVSGGTVEVSCECDEQHVVIEVRDTGRGITPDELPQVFERFYRGRGDSRSSGNSSTTGYEGSGLGLSIVKRIVANHGGQCTAASRVGDGATFRVSLPASIG
jgi:heavy metal sensor kinase